MNTRLCTELAHFLNDNRACDIENNGYKIWKTTYDEHGLKLAFKPIINVIFSRYQADNVSETIMGQRGYVLAIPCYWIDVDTELVKIYLGSYIDRWIENQFGSESGDDDGSGCQCGNGHCPNLNPPPEPPPCPCPPAVGYV